MSIGGVVPEDGVWACPLGYGSRIRGGTEPDIMMSEAA